MNATLKTMQEVELAAQALKSMGLRPHPTAVEKNWDLWKTIDFIQTYLPLHAAILDVGARWSPILERLELLGYENLWACDLKRSRREDLGRILRRSKIRFVQSDLTRTRFADQTFDALTSLSVIEHGVNIEGYLREMSRLLRPGGYLITSTDYWCQPVDVKGIFPYGPAFGEMVIFQPEGIREIVRIARGYGLELTEPLELECKDRVVFWERVNRRYTFVLFALRRQ